MNKRRFLGNFILVLFILFSAILVIVPAEAPDLYAAELKTLTESLKLTEPQIAEAGKILTMIRSQAQKDWEQHADNPEALIQAARLRQQLTDGKLEALLTPEQHVEYRKLKIQRDRDWEYFYLQEGLQLSEQQGVAIRAIVAGYRKKWEAVMPEKGAGMGGAGRGMRGGGMSSGMGVSQGGAMQGMGSTQGRGTSGARENRMTEMESEKNNRILEVLNDDQRKLAKRVFTMIRNEQENGIRRFMK